MPKTLSSRITTQLYQRAGGTQKSTYHAAGERILTNATELFARFGYNGVSTRDVALAAKVNEVTVYRHFAHKRDLYIAVLESELQQLRVRGGLLASIAEAPDSRTALACTFQLLSETLLPRPGVLRLLQYSALEMGQDFDPLIRKHLGELVEVVANYLEPWMKNDNPRCFDAKTILLTMIGIMISHGPLQRVFASLKGGPERMLDAYTLLAFSNFIEPPANQTMATQDDVNDLDSVSYPSA